MPKRFVVAGCGNIGEKKKDISVHVAKKGERKLNKKWIDFESLKRPY
jgi:hypothetical protein